MAKAANSRAGLLVVLVMLVVLANTATALAAGGKSIATATPVVYGQQEFGNTADDQHLEGSCNFNGDAWRSYWTLNVLAGDLLTIDWESGVPKTEIKIMPIGTTDFTFLKIEPAASQSLSSNGKNQLQYTAPQTGGLPLYFQACGFENVGGPYDFMATDQHALVVRLQQYPHIKSTTTLWGTASLANGTPVPDGLVFTLTASWGTRGQAQYQATSSSGALGFPLHLPTSAQGRFVTFAITRTADTQYQEAKSTGMKVKVALPRKRVRHHHRHHHHRHRHDAMRRPAASNGSLKQTCVQAGLERPAVEEAMMFKPGHARQTIFTKVAYPPMPEQCHGVFRRLGQEVNQLQDRRHRNRWDTTNPCRVHGETCVPFTRPFWIENIMTRDEGGIGGFGDTPSGHEGAWAYYHCFPGKAVRHVRILLRNVVRNLRTKKVVAIGKVLVHPVSIEGGSC